MNVPVMRLNSSGSSMLIVWPQFGITTSADDGMVCFISSPGCRQGQSSSPVTTRVGRVSRFMSSIRS